jgi:hypothetical protein
MKHKHEDTLFAITMTFATTVIVLNVIALIFKLFVL